MAATATDLELQAAIGRANTIVDLAVELNFPDADLQAMRDAIRVAGTPLAPGDDNAQDIERGQKIDALTNVIDPILIKDLNLQAIRARAAELQGRVDAVAASILASQDALNAAGAVPAARLEAIRIQRAGLAHHHHDISVWLDQLNILPRVVLGIDLGVEPTRTNAVAALGQIQAERARLAGIATQFVVDLETVTQAAADTIQALSNQLEAARNNPNIDARIAAITAQRDALRQRIARIGATKRNAQLVAPHHVEGITERRNAARAAADDVSAQLTVAMQIVELSRAVAVAQQALDAARAAIVAVGDPNAVEGVVNAQQALLNRQAAQINTARAAIPALPAGLPANLMAEANAAADAALQQIVDAQALVPQQIAAAQQVIDLQGAVAAAERAVTAARDAMQTALSPGNLYDVTRAYLNPPSLLLGAGPADINLDPALGLSPNLVHGLNQQAAQARRDIADVRGELQQAQAAVNARDELDNVPDGSRDFIIYGNRLVAALGDIVGRNDITDTQKLNQIRDLQQQIRTECNRIQEQLEIIQRSPAPGLDDIKRVAGDMILGLKLRDTELTQVINEIKDRIIATVETQTTDATAEIRALSAQLTAARDNPEGIDPIRVDIQGRRDALNTAIDAARTVAVVAGTEKGRRRDAAIRNATAVFQKLNRIIDILPYSRDAAEAQQAAERAINDIELAADENAKIEAIRNHRDGLAAQLPVLDNALEALEAQAPLIAMGTVDNLVKQEIAAVKAAKTAVQAAQTRAEHEELAAELNICIDDTDRALDAAVQELRDMNNDGSSPQEIIEHVEAQYLLLSQARQNLIDAENDARNVPAGIAHIAALRSDAANLMRELEDQYALLEEAEKKAKQDLANVVALDRAIENGDETYKQARVIIPRELKDPNRKPIEKITIIKQQQALLKEKIKIIRDRLTKVNGVEGIDLIKGAAEDKIEEMQGAIEYLDGPKQEQLKLAIAEIKQRAKDSSAEVRRLSVQLISDNQLLAQAIILDEPETKINRLKEKIKALETQLSAVNQAADIKRDAQIVHAEISVASGEIQDALATDKSYLDALPEEIDAINKVINIMPQIAAHQSSTAYLRDVIQHKGSIVQRLRNRTNLLDSEKQTLAEETYLLQSVIDELRKSEQALERLEAERTPVMQEAERVLLAREAALKMAVDKARRERNGFDWQLYSSELAEVQETLNEVASFNRKVWNHTVIVPAIIRGRGKNPTDPNTNIYPVDKSIDALKAKNAAVCNSVGARLIYGNAQRAAVEPPVELPVDKRVEPNTSFSVIQAGQRWRAESALKDATAAVAAFKENEEKVRPIIWALMGARITGDKKAEAEALREWNLWRNEGGEVIAFDNTAHRKKLHKKAKEAIDNLNEKMTTLGDAASPQLQAEAKLLKHQWSMADKEMRAIDMSNEIDLYAKQLQTVLKKIDEGIDELNKLKHDKTHHPRQGIDAEIAQIQDRLKALSAEAQFNAQMVVDLQSKRKKLKEEILLEGEKIEQGLKLLAVGPRSDAVSAAFAAGTDTDDAQRKAEAPFNQKITVAQSHTAAAQTALDDVLKQDLEVNVLVNRWNGLRLAHGQDVLPTAAEDLSREGKTLAERKAWAQWELFSLLEFRIEDIAKDPKLFDRYKKAMAILDPSRKVERNEEQIKALIGRSLEKYIKEQLEDNRPWTEQIKERIKKSRNGDSEPDPNKVMESGCQAQLDCWRNGEPRKFKQTDLKKYNAWKEELLKRQVETIANIRRPSEGNIAVVGIVNSNDHTMSFYAAEWDTTYQQYVSRGSLLTYVKTQMALLQETTDPAEQKPILDDVTTAIHSAKKDASFALSPATAQVAEAILSGLDAAGFVMGNADAAHLRAAVNTIDKKDPRVSAEDSSITADVPFEAVRRRMIADIILANPASPSAEKFAAQRVKNVYDTKNGVFTDPADITAAQQLEDRGFTSGDTFSTTIKNDKGEDEPAKYKITEKDGVIHLEMQKSNSRNHLAPPKTVAEIDIKGLDTGKTTASISAEPDVGANAAAIAAERIAAAISGGGNKSVTFKLKDYDRGWMDIRGKKGAEREAKYVKEILAKGIIPVFEAHEAKHHDSAVWASFKDLAVGAKKISDNSARDLYLDALFKTENAQLKKELISGMFMKTGELVEGELRICDYDDTKKVTMNALGLNEDMMRPRKSYTQAEFEALDEDKQKEIILKQAIKPQGVLENDKKFIHKEKLASGKIEEDEETEEFEISVGDSEEESRKEDVKPVKDRIQEDGDRRHYMGIKTK